MSRVTNTHISRHREQTHLPASFEDSHVWTSHAHDWVTSHIWMSHVTRANKSCHTYECVMSHIWITPEGQSPLKYRMQQTPRLFETPMCCSVLQRVAACCSVLQCVAVCVTACNRRQDYLKRLCVAACCSVLQRVAACCSVLQRVAACVKEIPHATDAKTIWNTYVLRWVAVCCSALQRAVCCSVLQYVLGRYCTQQTPRIFETPMCCRVLQCVAACCSVLQRVAVCGSVLQRVAVCGSVLQRVAVCYSVLQCVLWWYHMQ